MRLLAFGGKIRINKDIDWVAQILVNIHLFFLMIWNLSTLDRIFCFIPMMLCGVLGIIYTLYCKRNNTNLVIIIFYYVLTTFGMIASSITENRTIIQYAFIWGYIGIALLLLNFKLSTSNAKFLFYFSCFWYLVRVILGLDGYIVFIKIGKIPAAALILVFLLNYYIECLKNKEDIKLFPAALGLVIAIIAIGRAGIISFVLLIIFVVAFQNKKYKFSLSKAVVKILLVLGLVIGVLYYFFNNTFLTIYNRFFLENLTNSRTVIWDTYINSMLKNTERIVFGVPLTSNYYFVIYEGNLHNSFLNLHSSYGLAGIVLMAGLIIVSGLKYLKTKRFLVLSFLLVVVIRAFSDLILFGNIADPIFITLLWLPFFTRVLVR